jgi:hypothetical protein
MIFICTNGRLSFIYTILGFSYYFVYINPPTFLISLGRRLRHDNCLR